MIFWANDTANWPEFYRKDPGNGYPDGIYRLSRWQSPKRPTKRLVADSINKARTTENYNFARGSGSNGAGLRHSGVANFVRTDGSASSAGAAPGEYDSANDMYFWDPYDGHYFRAHYPLD